MNLPIRFWKRILYFVITGSTSIFIAACYGMPMTYKYLGVWKISVEDSENTPIKGLEVKVLQYSSGMEHPETLNVSTTDSLGEIETELHIWDEDLEYSHKALISDIDSTENGGFFQDTIVEYRNNNSTKVQMRKRDDDNS